MTEQDLANTVAGLSKCKINVSDNRFINLRTTVQRKMRELQLETRVRIAWGLSKIKGNTELVNELLESLRASVKHMTFGEVATVSWIIAKTRARNVAFML